ncbi:DNA alkylation repair protein [Clostridium hydrogeniformans]|uniref:DNA alkylation repair protein n=1 Tax=Clostridium hydrogeniformans TaxID=349933 RepID=UPI0004891C83|nr:DNA alkylation repair protein [Clostridium hydrogeniformans]
MNKDYIIEELGRLGTEQTKKTYIRHGAKEPLFGVKIGDIKTLVKYVKKNQELALELYDTGIFEAMYLVSLSIDPKLLTKEELERWMSKSNWPSVSEDIIAKVAAESNFALELASDWIKSEDELIAICGWNTYSNYLSITKDELLNLSHIKRLLNLIEETIHEERNRVRYTMNNFVISVGAFVKPLYNEALSVAHNIGKVNVNLGETACKVPVATEYLKKIEERGSIGKKKKTCIC